MTPPALVIFDCDGVLVDSEVLEHAIDAELLAPYGYVATVEELIDLFVGIARRDMYATVFGELGREVPPGLLEERERLVWDRCHSDLAAITGVHVALDGLGGVRKCVASSSTPEKLALKLQSTDLTPYFSPHIFSTALVAHGKPAPDIYLYAAHTVGVPAADCIVIEDSPHGIAGARAARMTVFGFIGGGHATPALGASLKAAGARHIVSAMADLPKLLLAP